MKNGFAGSAANVKINSLNDYNDKGYDTSVVTGVTVSARNPGSWSNGVKVAIIDSKSDQILGGVDVASPEGKAAVQVGYGVTQTMVGKVISGAGSTSAADGYLKGIVTEVGTDTLGVKVLSHVNAAGTETNVDYQPSGIYSFDGAGTVAIHTAGQSASYATATPSNNQDWFDQQSISLTNATINWNNIAERPGTSSYAAGRGSRFDEIHVVVIDDEGKVTGNVGTILEKNLSLSKAKDAEFSLGSPSYWRKFIANSSTTIFGGSAPAGIVATDTTTVAGFSTATDIGWDQNAQGISFGGSGAQNYTLSGGKNYDGGTDTSATGAFQVTLSGLAGGYELFEDNNLYQSDFIPVSYTHLTLPTKA